MPTLYKPGETWKKIKALAETVPGAKFILPSLPESVESGEEPLSIVSGVGAFGPGPLGITKGALIRRLAEFGPEEAKLARRVPKGLYKYVSEILDLGKRAPGETHLWHTHLRELAEKQDWAGLHHVTGSSITSPSMIGFVPKKVTPYTVGHEFGHELAIRMPIRERRLLLHWWDKAKPKEKLSYENLFEMLGDAYSDYIVGLGAQDPLDVYPEIIQRYVKKYHKLMR